MLGTVVGGIGVLERGLLAATLALTALTNCGGTAVGTGGEGDDPPDCVGDYSGTYDGDVRGVISGTLSKNWSFRVTFSPNNSETSYTVSGRVDEEGKIGINQDDALTGTLNFNRCRARGTWTTGEATGDWTASLD